MAPFRLAAALLAGAALCSATQDQACAADTDETGMLQKSSVTRHSHRTTSGGEDETDCLTQADVDATIQAFMEAVPSLAPTASNCTLAKETATMIIATAYAYNVSDVTVQFKPTLTSYPNVYRPTADGALSYFIGPCVCPGAKDILSVNPEGCGIEDGHYPGDTGFAFAPGHEYKGWAKVTYGGTAKGGAPDTNFWYNLGGPFCKTPTAQGPLCFTPNTGAEATCVDKTFGFVPNPDPNGALKALLSTHDSSLQFQPE